MIAGAVLLKSSRDLLSKNSVERINVTVSPEGRIQAISWRYDSSDSGLYSMVKRLGGEWNRDAGGWVFPDLEGAQSMFDKIVKRHPEWPVIGHPDRRFLPMAGVLISRLHLAAGLDACLTPAQLSSLAHLDGKARAFRLTGKDGKVRSGELGLLLGSPDEIDIAIGAMVEQGAICDDALARKWPAINTRKSKLQVKVTGWAVKITCDLSSLAHFSIAPTPQYRWEGKYPNGVKLAVPWDGVIYITRKHWPSLKAKILAAGLECKGDDPDATLTVPASFDASRVAGWDTPAPNGHLLHAYQKIGAQFCAERGMRALIGDEMGVGKTVQAIAAAEACSSPRVVVICPANARYVWDREIEGWGGQGGIQHVTSQLSKLDPQARWHIITYELIVARAETWRFRDDAERQAFVDTFPKLAPEIQHKGSASHITLSKPLVEVPAFDTKRVAAWAKIMQRLRGELLEQILAIGPLLVILDEAHRVKNKNAKRTNAIQRIAAGESQMLMLTGTPLRNNEHEAATLLSLLDDEAAGALCDKQSGYTIEDIKDCLGHFMIRRTKAEVLPELPEKTRQRIDIDDLDADQMARYADALAWAMKCHDEALIRGKSTTEARQAMQGGIEKARSALGVAKILGGGVSDLVIDVVENKGCCVVFCAHHEASDTLKAQLVAKKLRVAIVDGRTAQKDRATLVEDFQDGRLDVFIGGINAAGEAITLTRSDTVIFVELDWVPAALLQAEDRVHRVGQRSNCQIIQLVARMPGGTNLDEIMIDLIGAKMARIGEVLGEDGNNIIAGDIRANLWNRILGEAGNNRQNAPVPARARIVESDAQAVLAAPSVNKEKAQDIASPANVEKRGRGRPKVYVGNVPPTAAERSKQSNKALADAGGKRVMLRLTPEAHEALKIIMAIMGSTQETATINQALIRQKNQLLQASTKKQSSPDLPPAHPRPAPP